MSEPAKAGCWWCGEPRVGKTALLEYALRQAPGFRVARATSIQAETRCPTRLPGRAGTVH